MELDKKIRNKTIKDISKFFDKKTSKKIEESIFQFSMNYAMDNETPFLFEQIYNTKSEELIVQFGDSKMLVKKIINKNFKPEEIAFLKVEHCIQKNMIKFLRKRILKNIKRIIRKQPLHTNVPNVVLVNQFLKRNRLEEVMSLQQFLLNVKNVVMNGD